MVHLQLRVWKIVKINWNMAFQMDCAVIVPINYESTPIRKCSMLESCAMPISKDNAMLVYKGKPWILSSRERGVLVNVSKSKNV